MVILCAECDTYHAVGKSCEEARLAGEQFAREVKHHKQRCKGCPDPMKHVLNLRELERPLRDLKIG